MTYDPAEFIADISQTLAHGPSLLQVEISQKMQNEQKLVSQQLTAQFTPHQLVLTEILPAQKKNSLQNTRKCVSSFSHATQRFEFWLFLLLGLGRSLTPCLYGPSAHVFRKCLSTMAAQIVCAGRVAGIVCMQMKGSCSSVQWEQCLK